jgi:hypothetical protein
MADHMTSPGERQPPKDCRLENVCRIAAFRLRQAQPVYFSNLNIENQAMCSQRVWIS